MILFLHILTFFINSVLGIGVLKANSKSIFNRLYTIFSLSVGLWSLSLFLTIIAAPGQLIWSRLAFSFGVIMFVSLFYFSFVYPQKKKIPLLLHVFVGIPGGLIFIGTLTPYMVRTVEVVEGFITGDLGFVISLFTPFILILGVLSLVVVFVNFIRSKGGVIRAQLSYVLMGIGFFVATFLTTNLVLPVFFGIFDYNNLGPVFSIPMLISIGYAMVRYHLMDIRVVIRRGAVFSILFAVVIFIFTLSTSFLDAYFSEIVSKVIASLVITFFFFPFKEFLESATEKIFFRKHYKFQESVSELSHLFISVFDLETLLDELVARIKKYFGLEVAFVAVDKGEHFKNSVKIGDVPFHGFLSEENPVIRYFYDFHGEFLKPKNNFFPFSRFRHPREILDRGELSLLLQREDFDDTSVFFPIIKKLEAGKFMLAAPVFFKDRLLGALFLGEKKSGDPFFEQDIQLVEFIIHQAAFSIENARIFAKLVELDSAKSEFIRVVSHHLRTPLSGALWSIESLSSEGKAGSKIPKKEKGIIEDVGIRLQALNHDLDGLITAFEIIEGKAVVEHAEIDFVEQVISPIEKNGDTRRKKSVFCFRSILLKHSR